MAIWRKIWISLINCNFTAFYPIEMGFSPDIIEFHAEKCYPMFTISFLNHLSDTKFGHHIWHHNSSHMRRDKNQNVGYVLIYILAKFRYIWCILGFLEFFSVEEVRKNSNLPLPSLTGKSCILFADFRDVWECFVNFLPFRRSVLSTTASSETFDGEPRRKRSLSLCNWSGWCNHIRSSLSFSSTILQKRYWTGSDRIGLDSIRNTWICEQTSRVN